MYIGHTERYQWSAITYSIQINVMVAKPLISCQQGNSVEMYCRIGYKAPSLCGIDGATDVSTTFSYPVTCPAFPIGPSEQFTKCV